jgi:sec-independent protein translocase protein TatA
MFRMGPWEIALIVVIVLIVFGAGKLPQVGSAIGKGIRSFRKGASGELDDDEEEEEEEVKPRKRATATRKRAKKSS